MNTHFLWVEVWDFSHEWQFCSANKSCNIYFYVFQHIEGGGVLLTTYQNKRANSIYPKQIFHDFLLTLFINREIQFP